MHVLDVMYRVSASLASQPTSARSLVPRLFPHTTTMKTFCLCHAGGEPGNKANRMLAIMSKTCD